ncbi:hypothetical protein [Alienimonas californiensis]|uniref:Uncharacterized protein n=1 Tax=Alienimonas californiensis TaxID=2527989 RepID=A0A517P6N7_9PLAN|nr:hypothetical protein [Alienimonas californiensis]QDT15035.1 hypothetical protein CA12_11150 [Alienimonas californiensis]
MTTTLARGAPPLVPSLLVLQPMLGPIVGWLRRDGFDPEAVLVAAAARLRERGRNLPEPLRNRYLTTVLAGEFLARWVKKNDGRTTRDWIEDGKVVDEAGYDEQLRPFEYAVVLTCDERAFDRQIDKLVRRSEADRSNLHYGDRSGFAAYSAQSTLLLANRMLKNFKPSYRRAERHAVNYLLKTAASAYLHRCAKETDFASGEILRHLKRSKKVSRRSVVAYKLVYCPANLVYEERKWLRERYGWKDSVARAQVQEVACLLGYESAAALSRKFYRMRGWAKSAAERREEAGR